MQNSADSFCINRNILGPLSSSCSLFAKAKAPQTDLPPSLRTQGTGALAALAPSARTELVSPSRQEFPLPPADLPLRI